MIITDRHFASCIHFNRIKSNKLQVIVKDTIQFCKYRKTFTLLQLAESLRPGYDYKIFEVKADWLNEKMILEIPVSVFSRATQSPRGPGYELG